MEKAYDLEDDDLSREWEPSFEPRHRSRSIQAASEQLGYRSVDSCLVWQVELV